MTGVSGAVLCGTADEGERLDVFISQRAEISRSRAQKHISEGRVCIDGEKGRKNHVISAGEAVTWELPDPEPEEIIPEELPLDIIFEDSQIVVIDKAAEMVMYPGPGHASGTLLNALIARYPDIEGVGGRGRPGVFHRLDRGTSGLVAIARTDEAYDRMVKEIRERAVKRVYLALVVGGVPANAGTIDAPMGRSRTNRKKMAIDMFAGKPAVSIFEVLERFADDFTFVEVQLQTGRTHQIRVHFSHIGHPVAGDPEYSRGKAGKRLGLGRQFLHAHKLEFEHPVTGESMCFASELPQDLGDVLAVLRGQY